MSRRAEYDSCEDRADLRRDCATCITEPAETGSPWCYEDELTRSITP